MTGTKIKVLLVEDSLTVLKLLTAILSEDPHFEIIGSVTNGALALEFVKNNRPDVISMDINMPVMDGIEATRQIMHLCPVPIVIVSSMYDSTGIQMSFDILKAGALTILPKPNGPGHPNFEQTAKEYRNMLKLMSRITVTAKKIIHGNTHHFEMQVQKNDSINYTIQRKIIAIGASAGGPIALQTILNKIPKSIPVPILIVQHIDSNFADGFCNWLNATSSIKVNIARDGEKLLPGQAYLPPADSHLGIHKEGIAIVSKEPPERNLRPAVSYLFNSVAKTYGKNAIAILLSGMGQDGANELKILHNLGSLTIAQDEATSLVHGMPGEAIRIGGASLILSPENIVNELVKLYKL